MTVWWTVAGAFLLGALGTEMARSYALRRGVLDVPGTRSSHTRPVPRGGGIALVAASTAALVVLWLSGRLPGWLAAAWTAPLAVALVGWIDDHRHLSPALRLAVHLGAAAWLLFSIPVQTPGWAGWLFGVLGGAWVVNLYNFMDGIDGLAAAEAIFVCLAAGWLMDDQTRALSGLTWAVAGACAGFLPFNLPPARIFMGDVGSAFLGAVLVTLALAAQASDALPLATWLVLGAVFWVDATYTLAVRLLRGQRVWQPHRGHAYQILARRWGGHGRVTMAVLLYDALWLLPLAVWSEGDPHRGYWAVVMAAGPVLLLCLWSGAGRRPHDARAAA